MFVMIKKIGIIDLLIVLFVIIILLIGIKILFFQKTQLVYIQLQLCEKTNPYSLTNCGKVLETAISDIKTGNLTENAEIIAIKENKIEVNQETRKNILLNLKLNADKKSSGLYFQNQELKENALLFIKGDKTSLQGVITRISPSIFINKIKEKIITLELYNEMYNIKQWQADSIELYNIRQWQADSILIEDKELINNKTIAVIISKEVKDAEIEAVDSYGNVLKKTSPIFKNIKLKIKVYAEKENNKLIFKGKELKIGETLTLTTERAEFSGIITEIF